jgi:hypothetical protein
MGSPECLSTWQEKKTGEIFEYRPFYVIVNELKNFLSGADARKMIDFLVDIYDETEFSTGFKNEASQKFYNPFLSVLCCATPHWFISELKIDLFTGGLGRRLFILCRERNSIVPNPAPPKGYEEMKKRCYDHLVVLNSEQTQGEVKRTPEAMEYWEKIYREIKSDKPDDPILKQFNESKPVMVLKLALILSFDQMPFTYECKKSDLEDAYGMLNALSKDIRMLTGGIGKNPMAGVAQAMLQFVITNNGLVREKRLRQMFWKDSPNGERDYNEGKAHLKKTQEIVEFPWTDKGVSFRMVATLDKFKDLCPEQYAAMFTSPNPPPSGA